MNIFDILRDTFRDRHNFYQARFNEMSGTDRDVEDWGSVKSYADAIEIVNKVEQEYNKKYAPIVDLIEFGVDSYNSYLDSRYKEGYEDGLNANKWIPCSVRLPEEKIDVLIYYVDKDREDDRGGIAISDYREVTFGGQPMGYKDWMAPFSYFHANYEVVAWQPLPLDYEEIRDGN